MSCLVIYFMVLINSRMTCAVSVLTTVSVKCAKRRLSHFMYEDYLIVLFVYLKKNNYTVLQIEVRLLLFSTYIVDKYTTLCNLVPLRCGKGFFMRTHENIPHPNL